MEHCGGVASEMSAVDGVGVGVVGLIAMLALEVLSVVVRATALLGFMR